MVDDDDEHKHSEGGEAMMSDDDDLMKGRAEEREEMFGFGLVATAVNIGIRADFFRIFYLYQNNLKINIKINLSGSGFRICGFIESGSRPGNVWVENIESGYRILFTPVRVEPGPDFPGSSGSGFNCHP